MQLVGADALLAGAHEVRGLEDLMRRNAGVFENRADSHSELLLAVAALVQAVADALLGVRLDAADAVRRAAMDADGTGRPDHLLQEGESGFLIVKVRLAEDRHSLNSLAFNRGQGNRVCKIHSRPNQCGR